MGAHLEKGEQAALPKKLRDFMDRAEDGVILFSLGFTMHPTAKYEPILEALSRLPQRVVMKLDVRPKQVPKNIMVRTHSENVATRSLNIQLACMFSIHS